MYVYMYDNVCVHVCTCVICLYMYFTCVIFCLFSLLQVAVVDYRRKRWWKILSSVLDIMLRYMYILYPYDIYTYTLMTFT